MYFLLSPAKSLNETEAIPVNLGNYYSQPELIEHSQTLMKNLKSKEPIDLQELMSISDDLAQLNAKRNQDWAWSDNEPFTDDASGNTAKAAGYLFDGDVYTGLDMYGMDKDTAIYVNEHLGILSGLYGVLKPLDLIQPYRLEMGTKLKNERGDNLYEFWGEEVTNTINSRMAMADSDDKVLVNLASNEYFKSVKKKALHAEIITPRFEDEKNGTYKVISFYAKKARGLMVKYAADNKLTKAEQLKKFDLAGYYYCAEASDDKTWTFRRDEANQYS
ncbi:peroxide stress protein YaaA [Psychrobacter sp. FME5]|uniref:peroxide stress protein YaaA n=1 Tax=Psychrobacter sp. FME5 TaxID=2487706 RepID=UPI001787C73D|nr:peroxide stress protein YaaA [Psychrobacter sp. FME5]MBE0445235.1 peroxide stress protein YaaA [Psychrobacter sp. FME5]MDN5802101.1 peroxide stress protein YaaA [Psychrobacter sp.]